MNNNDPNYQQIYSDILLSKFPNKKEKCKTLLSKNNLSALDIIELNNLIFEHSDRQTVANQKLKSYRKSDILRILDYQKKHKLNNSKLAKHFSLSRNTVAKWKKIFLVEY